MKRLVNTPSFVAIASGEAQSGYPPQSITDTFIDEIIALVRKETNYETLFRTLRYTRFRLTLLQETCHIENGMGKKCIGTAFRH